jgi:hypothetical protein
MQRVPPDVAVYQRYHCVAGALLRWMMIADETSVPAEDASGLQPFSRLSPQGKAGARQGKPGGGLRAPTVTSRPPGGGV